MEISNTLIQVSQSQKGIRMWFTYTRFLVECTEDVQGWFFRGYGKSWEEEKVLAMDGGDGCTAMWTHVLPQTNTLNMINFMWNFVSWWDNKLKSTMKLALSTFNTMKQNSPNTQALELGCMDPNYVCYESCFDFSVLPFPHLYNGE